jgi:capsular exopolysaccharide synthesis family protein
LLSIVPDSRSLNKQGTPGHPAIPSHADLEPFRLLRARLRYFNVDRNIQSVLVTSAAPSEGKSTVAWHLALASAASGDSRVLLIEADLRRPTLARQRGVNPMPGLAELLTHDLPLHEVIQRVPVGAAGEDEAALEVIAAGLVPPNPAALIESKRMSDLLQFLFREYDFVVIDTPPTSVVSDAMPLVPQVDGVVVVSRFAQTTREAATRQRQDLEELRAPLLGFVVNGVRGAEGGYYGYGYGYGYGPDVPVTSTPAPNGANGNGSREPVGAAPGSAPSRSFLRRRKR